MRKAVVPIKEMTVNHGDEFAVLDGVCGALCADYKLTKEDIDTMAATLFKETSGPGYCHLTRADTKRIAAAMAVSIGLEVDD